ncbi:Uncharacterised protein [Enterobacter cloacae]|nr:Uncharacterised protein [Enterobacter cloacae]
MGDPQSQKVGANKFEHQNDGKRRDYRDGNKGKECGAGRKIVGNNGATAGLEGGENGALMVSNRPFVGQLFGHPCGSISILQVGDKR